MNRLLQYLFQFLLQLWRRLLSLLRRGRHEREMEEEMRFHLEMQIEQNLEAGMAPEDARDAARRQFGNQTWLKEASREMWSLNLIETLIQDLRYGARMLMKNPGFAFIAVLTLALGIGANTAIFSVVNAVLLSPLPFHDAKRLVAVGQNSPRNRTALSATSHRNFVDCWAQNKVFEDMAAYYGGVFTLMGQGGATRLRGAVVTHSLFNVLRAAPLLGRTFLPDDDKAGGGVGDTKHTGPRGEPTPEIYFAQAQMPMDTMAAVIRATGDPHALTNAAREALREINQNASVFRFRTLDEYFVRTIAAPRFNTLLIGLFAVVALVITMVGLYGVISYAVSQNTHEFGVRMALGAQAKDILRLVLRQGMTSTLLGIALGLMSAFALTRRFADLLYDVSPTDPLTFCVVALLLAAVALPACYIPARRATKVDPIVALRTE